VIGRGHVRLSVCVCVSWGPSCNSLLLGSSPGYVCPESGSTPTTALLFPAGRRGAEGVPELETKEAEEGELDPRQTAKVRMRGPGNTWCRGGDAGLALLFLLEPRGAEGVPELETKETEEGELDSRQTAKVRMRGPGNT